MSPCACGCGGFPRTRRARYLPGHNPHPVPAQTPEVRAKISAANRGANHPSRRHPELWLHLIEGAREKCLRGTSHMEEEVNVLLGPGWIRHSRIGGRQHVDFYNPALKLAVEVNGCWHHSCPTCHPEGPQYEVQRKVRSRDRLKRDRLDALGIRLEVLWGHDRARFGELLKAAGVTP